MFTDVLASIRAYVIRQLTQQVVADVATSGLNQADEAIIDALLTDKMRADAPSGAA